MILNVYNFPNVKCQFYIATQMGLIKPNDP
jgi:hypothetical protein